VWHVETFNSRGGPGEMEALLRRALAYWRSKGFTVKAFTRQYSLGSAEFWLFTELDSYGDFERWPAMATGDEEGREIMHELLRLAEGMSASVIKEIEA
jgi:hypothetical protein